MLIFWSPQKKMHKNIFSWCQNFLLMCVSYFAFKFLLNVIWAVWEEVCAWWETYFKFCFSFLDLNFQASSRDLWLLKKIIALLVHSHAREYFCLVLLGLGKPCWQKLLPQKRVQILSIFQCQVSLQRFVLLGAYLCSIEYRWCC